MVKEEGEARQMTFLNGLSPQSDRGRGVLPVVHNPLGQGLNALLGIIQFGKLVQNSGFSVSGHDFCFLSLRLRILLGLQVMTRDESKGVEKKEGKKKEKNAAKEYHANRPPVTPLPLPCTPTPCHPLPKNKDG